MLAKQDDYNQSILPLPPTHRFFSPPLTKRNAGLNKANHRRSQTKTKPLPLSIGQSNAKQKSLIKLINNTLTQSEFTIPMKTVNNTSLIIQHLTKTEPALPVLTKSSAVAKFIIRGYKPLEETKEYVKSTKIKEKISNSFFHLMDENKKKKLKSRLEFFEKNKKGALFEKEESSSSRPIQHVSNMKTITNENEQLREAKIKEEGRNLANMVLNVDTDEKITLYDDTPSSDEISRKNLHNVIIRRRIMKDKGKFINEDGALGIDDLNQIRKERQLTEHHLSKKTQLIGVPKFIKCKFFKDTTMKFKGVNGKYFGVIC